MQGGLRPRRRRLRLLHRRPRRRAFPLFNRFNRFNRFNHSQRILLAKRKRLDRLLRPLLQQGPPARGPAGDRPRAHEVGALQPRERQLPPHARHLHDGGSRLLVGEVRVLLVDDALPGVAAPHAGAAAGRDPAPRRALRREGGLRRLRLLPRRRVAARVLRGDGRARAEQARHARLQHDPRRARRGALRAHGEGGLQVRALRARERAARHARAHQQVPAREERRGVDAPRARGGAAPARDVHDRLPVGDGGGRPPHHRTHALALRPRLDRHAAGDDRHPLPRDAALPRMPREGVAAHRGLGPLRHARAHHAVPDPG